MFTRNNITVKRPAGGLDPTRYFEILEKSKNYVKDQKI